MVNKFIALFLVVAVFLVAPSVEANGEEVYEHESEALGDIVEAVGTIENVVEFTKASLNNLAKVKDIAENTWNGVKGWVSGFSDGSLASSTKRLFGALADVFEWIAGFIRNIILPFTDNLED